MLIKIRESWAIVFLMNTKGLVELIVLNIGVDAGVINGPVFTVMVMMAVLTTVITSPVVSFIYPIEYHTMTILPKKQEDEENPVTEVLSTRAKVLIAFNEIGQVASLTNLLRMFKMDNQDDSISASLLKLTFSNLKSSNIIMATQTATLLVVDPAVKIFQLFCQFIGIETSAEVVYSTNEDFSEAICRIAVQDEVNLSIVSWNDDSSVRSFFDTSAKSQQYKNIMRFTPVSVGIFVDRNLEIPASPGAAKKQCKVLFAFTGCRHDFEALSIALRWALHPGIDVSILALASIAAGTQIMAETADGKATDTMTSTRSISLNALNERLLGDLREMAGAGMFIYTQEINS